MKIHPAIATVEFRDIAVGLHATDAMLKRAPIDLIKSGTVSHGRFLTLIAGTTASVEESYAEGLTLGGDSVVDSVLLLDVHSEVHDAVLGQRTPCLSLATAIIETNTVSSNIRAAELALKGTDVRLVELRLADSLLSGKGLSIYQGELYEIESAIEIASNFLESKRIIFVTKIIPAPHEGLVEQINFTTTFNKAKLLELEGEGSNNPLQLQI